MNPVSFSQTRNNLKSVLDEVSNDDTTTIITRRDSANTEHLIESIAKLEAGKTVEQDRKALKRMNGIFIRTPFEGIGNPEALRENLSGFWSRRIDEENRLVHNVNGNNLSIISCRYHY